MKNWKNITRFAFCDKKVSQCDVFEKFLSQQKVNKIKGFQAFCDVCDVFTVLFLLLQEKEEKVNKYYILIENGRKNVKNVTEVFFRMIFISFS